MAMIIHRLGSTLMALLVVLVMVGLPVVVLAVALGPTHDFGDSAVRTEARQTYKAEAVYEFTHRHPTVSTKSISTAPWNRASTVVMHVSNAERSKIA